MFRDVHRHPQMGFWFLKYGILRIFQVLLNIDLELMFKRNPGAMMLSELCLS